MLRWLRQRKAARKAPARITRLFGPEPLEHRTLLTASPLSPAGSLASVSASSSQYSTSDILVQFRPGTQPHALLAGTTVGSQMALVAGLYQIKLSAGVSVASAVAAYQKAPSVSLAEPDYYLSTSQVPNDPYFNQQWDLNNTGQTGGTPGADIHAEQAWNVTTGGTPIPVAMMDTGIDYTHPDLYRSVWINQAEIPRSRLQNLTDVYHDGYISWRDLNNPINIGPGKITDVNGDGRIDAADILAPMVRNSQGQDTGQGGWAYPGNTQDGDTAHPNDFIGWNFVANNNNPFDDNGHGTHVSGTVAASGNNSVGIAGIDWNAQLMPVKFLDNTGSGTISDFIAGLNYAVAHGARISNNSWQGAPNDPLLNAAISNARSHGQIFVVAAGNGGANTDTSPVYPASFKLDNIVSVAASDNNDQLASFSNYGPNTISLAAPGVNILSTEPQDSYGYLSGTSMATPHVTGALALVWSLHPGWTYQQVINQVLNTVDKEPGLSGKVITGGRLDVASAVGWNLSSRTTPAIVNSYPTGPSGTVNGAVVVFNEAVDASTFQPWDVTLLRPDGTAITASSVTVQSSSGDRTFTIAVAPQTQSGTYTLRVSTVKDLQGNVMTPYQTTFQNVNNSGGGGGTTSGTAPAIVNSYPFGPTGTVNGAVVVFNEPVNPATFQTGNVTLTRPDGSTVAINSVSVQSGSNNQAFTIAAAPQTQTGTYTLRISSVKDAQGDVMQSYQTTFQNVNNSGGGGSPGTTPTIVNSYPYGASGSVNGAVVVFNEAVDPTTFQTHNVTLTRPDGSTVAINSVSVQSGSRNQTYNIAVSPQTQTGTYTLRISSVKDAQGDVMQPYQTTFRNGSSASSSVAGAASTQTANRSTTVKASSPVAIPSNGIAVSSLRVDPSVTIGSIQVGLSIQHTQDSNLYIHLTAPDGTDVVLSNRRGGTGQNYTSTVFTASAATAVSKGQAPFTGAFRPDGSLGSLAGKNASGTWKLWVQNLATGHTGTLSSWSLTIVPAGASG